MITRVVRRPWRAASLTDAATNADATRAAPAARITLHGVAPMY
jgi:hypothetical protein